MRSLRYVLVLGLALALPAVPASVDDTYKDENYEPPEDKETIEVVTGYQGSSTDGSPQKVAEFEVVEPNPIVGIKYVTSPFDEVFLSFMFNRLSSRQNYGEAEFDLKRTVRIDASLGTLPHRLDHDPISNLQAVSEIKVVRSTDLQPDAVYGIRYRDWNVRGEFQHPRVSWFQWRVGYRAQQRTGSEQVLTTSHCTSCHTTSQGRDVDQSITDAVFGVHFGKTSAFQVDYQFTGRQARDEAGTTLAPYDSAFRPATPGSAPDPTALIKPFNDRLWFQAGDYATQVVPETRREIHQLKLRSELGQKAGIVNFTVVKSNSENVDTTIDYDFDAWRGRYTMRPTKRMRLNFTAQRDKIQSDDSTINLVSLNGLSSAPVTRYPGFADPISFQGWRQAVDTTGLSNNLVFNSFTRRSSLDRTDDRLGIDWYWRAARHGSLRIGWKYRGIDRDNVVLLDGTGKTETHRIKIAWNQRLAKRLRWNNKLVWKDRSNPYAADAGWLRAFAGYRDEANGIVNGQSGSPKLPESYQYYQLQALRVAAGSNLGTEQVNLRSAINWAPTGRWTLNGTVRLGTSENDELNYSTWEQDREGIGAYFWMAASPVFHFTLGADLARTETDAATSIPLMDG